MRVLAKMRAVIRTAAKSLCLCFDSVRVLNRATVQVSNWLRIPATLLIGTRPAHGEGIGRVWRSVAVNIVGTEDSAVARDWFPFYPPIYLHVLNWEWFCFMASKFLQKCHC
jgi:hypothetical protein